MAINNLEKRTLRARNETIDELVESVAPSDIAQVLLVVEKLTPDEFRSLFREKLLERWAETEEEPAMAYAEKVSGVQHRQQAIISVLGSWATHDVAKAAEWVKKLPAGLLRDEAVATLVPVLTESNPEQALLLAQDSIKPGSEMGGLAGTIFQALTAADPQATAARALKLASGAFRTEAISAVASQWAEVDPQGALEWAKGLSMGGERLNALRSVVGKWAGSNPTAASEFVLSLPPSQMQNQMRR